MTRRLLDLCLLAYPSAQRNRDREYLRDLALELAQRYGWRRQIVSILRGGVAERINRRRSGRGPGQWVSSRRAAAGCGGLVATALVATAVGVLAAGQSERVEADRSVCVTTTHATGDCAAERALVGARQRSGWDCEARRARPGEVRRFAWHCTLEAAAERAAL